MAKYDTVVSIGGQSFVDGLWRVFGPALEGLTNPLPIAIPGFSNAEFRITELIPQIPGPVQPAGALNITLMVEVVAEAMLHVVSETGAVTLTGVPSLQLPPIPSPAVVPVPVDLTPGKPLALPAVVTLTVEGPSAATRSSLKFTIAKVEITSFTVDPNLANSVAVSLQSAVDQLVGQLALPVGLQSAIDPADIADMVAPLGNLVPAAVAEALTNLIAETGRVVYPGAGAGASSDAEVLPIAGDAQFILGTSGDYVLQVGFRRSGSNDIDGFPPFTPTGLVDCKVLIGNRFLLELIAAVIPRLPTFAVIGEPIFDFNDVQGHPHTMCFNFSNVSANLGVVTVANGGLSICLDAWADHRKRLTLVGHFADAVDVKGAPKIADITIDFTLPIDFDVNGAVSIVNLRTGVNGDVKISADVSITWWFQIFLVTVGIAAGAVVGAVIGAIIGGILGGILGGLGSVLGGLLGGLLGGAGGGASLGGIAAAVVIAVVRVGALVAKYVLNRAVRSLLSGASLLPSPVAVPPGLVDAFGKLASSIEVLDDLIVHGVLETPTSPWALLPRLGSAKRDPGPKGRDKPRTTPRKSRAKR